MEILSSTLLQLYYPCIFMFRSFTHLDTPFVYDVRLGSHFTFLQVAVQLIQYLQCTCSPTTGNAALTIRDFPGGCGSALSSSSRGAVTGLLLSQSCLLPSLWLYEVL